MQTMLLHGKMFLVVKSIGDFLPLYEQFAISCTMLAGFYLKALMVDWSDKELLNSIVMLIVSYCNFIMKS